MSQFSIKKDNLTFVYGFDCALGYFYQTFKGNDTLLDEFKTNLTGIALLQAAADHEVTLPDKHDLEATCDIPLSEDLVIECKPTEPTTEECEQLLQLLDFLKREPELCARYELSYEQDEDGDNIYHDGTMVAIIDDGEVIDYEPEFTEVIEIFQEYII